MRCLFKSPDLHKITFPEEKISWHPLISPKMAIFLYQVNLTGMRSNVFFRKEFQSLKRSHKNTGKRIFPSKKSLAECKSGSIF